MSKFFVGCDTIEQVQAAHAAINNAAIPAHIANAPAPAATPHYSAPAAAAPNAPAPAVVPSQPGQFIPPQATAPAPAPVAAPVTAPATSVAPAAAEAHGITAAQLGAAAQNYSKLYKAAATKQVFAHFGIAKIGDAHPSIYPQLLAALTPQAA